jgi:hypothetical protein
MFVQLVIGLEQGTAEHAEHGVDAVDSERFNHGLGCGHAGHG